MDLRKLAISNNQPSKSAVANMAVGVSAAIAIRKYMKKERTTDKLNVYLSGNTWPKDIADFQIESFGFKDYNSADLVVTKDKKKFYGISLKKKKSVTASDPTLINKADSIVFSGADQGVDDTGLNKKAIDDLTKEITKTRIKYFAGLVRQAVKEGILLKEDLVCAGGSPSLQKQLTYPGMTARRPFFWLAKIDSMFDFVENPQTRLQ